MILLFKNIQESLVSSLTKSYAYFSPKEERKTNMADTIKEYKENVNSIPFFTNTMDTAIPQTDIYKMIEKHFNSPLKEGTTKKKAIIIGYDGCRTDALSFIDEVPNGGIRYLLNKGAKAELSYCGGINYPYFNKQETSTGPSWCSILTGIWAYKMGIISNGIKKSNKHLTNLTSLVEKGKIDSSAFYTTWDGHFKDKNATYIKEKEYVEEKGLNVKFVLDNSDEEFCKDVIDDIKSPNCTDYIFAIIEHTDHCGHESGFSTKNQKYVNAYKSCEADGRAIIDAIESRETFNTEDWLIIITSDHGGFKKGHGAYTIQERMTFIISK